MDKHFVLGWAASVVQYQCMAEDVEEHFIAARVSTRDARKTMYQAYQYAPKTRNNGQCTARAARARTQAPHTKLSKEAGTMREKAKWIAYARSMKF